MASVARVRRDAVVELAVTLAERLDRASWLWPLVIRIAAGLLFVSTGWRAVTHLDAVTAYFDELAIPLPRASAIVAGASELVCGALLVVGFAARMATLPLVVCMIVALATAKRPEIHGLTDLLMQVELAYIVMLIAIFIAGPGPVALDARRSAR